MRKPKPHSTNRKTLFGSSATPHPELSIRSNLAPNPKAALKDPSLQVPSAGLSEGQSRRACSLRHRLCADGVGCTWQGLGFGSQGLKLVTGSGNSGNIIYGPDHLASCPLNLTFAEEQLQRLETHEPNPGLLTSYRRSQKVGTL